MSFNQGKRESRGAGGSGGAAGVTSAGAGGGGNRNNKRKRGSNKRAGFSVNEEEDLIGNGNEVVTTTTTTGTSESSDGTSVFNSAEEDLGGGHDVRNNTYSNIVRGGHAGTSEDEEEDDDDEGGDNSEGVVNASLIVNLSNANVSVNVVEEDGAAASAKSAQHVVVAQDSSRGGRAIDTVIQPASPISPVAAVATSNTTTALDDDDDDEGIVEMDDIPVIGNSCNNGGMMMQNLSPAQQRDQVSCTSEESNLADFEVEKLMSGNQVADVEAGGDHGRDLDVAASGSSDVLPSTVTVLTAHNNVKVYLVGTAHFSHQSHVDVVKTIQQTNPTLVLLELCSSRRNILSLDEETVLKEVSEMNFQKIRLALSNSGTVQGVLHLLLLSMSAQLTRKLGMAPGGEFRAAMREARKIPNCVLLLGDRPFNITISRALAALSFFQKIKLAWQFLTSNEDITKEEIERCKELDAISMLLKEMTGEFPSITEVFVNERDVFLAHSLYLAATSEAHGGAAVGRDRVVVGIVGMGHVPGIVRNWGTTTDESVNELLRIPETPISSIIIRKSIKFCWYALLGYGMYKVSKRIVSSSNVNIDFGKIVGEKVVAVKGLIRGI